jgi:hypothetical protein
MSLLRQLFGPSREEIWRELARQIDAEYVEGGLWKGDKVEARVGPWVITLDTYTVSTGKSQVTYTRLRAPYVNRDNFRFHIYRAGFFSNLGKAMGMQDIQVGDAHLDEQFIIKSEDEGQVRALFANDRLKELLHGQPSVSLMVKDDEGWFGAHFPEGVDELHFQVVGVIKDVDRLRALFDLFAETLQQLCHIGSAYETDPFRPIHIPDQDLLVRGSEAPEGATLLRPASSAEGGTSETLLRPVPIAPAEEALPHPGAD